MPRVQSAFGTFSPGASPVALPAPATPGNTIIIVVHITGYIGAPSSVADNLNANGTYTLDDNVAAVGSSTVENVLVYRKLVANAPQTFTVNVSGRNHNVTVYEVSGLAASSPLDLHLTAGVAMVASPHTFPFTTNFPNEFAIAVLSDNSGGAAKVWGAGVVTVPWHYDGDIAAAKQGFESAVIAAAGTYNAEFTTVGATAVFMAGWVFSYKLAAAPPRRMTAFNRLMEMAGVFAVPVAAPAPPAPVLGPVPSAPTGLEIVAAAGTATLTWDAPTLNEDGSALSALTQYTVYWGHVAGDQYPSGPFDGGTPDVVAAGTLTLTKTLAAGTWFAAVTASNASGESFASGEATGVVS